jgi:SAM-dependent methyltransferase
MKICLECKAEFDSDEWKCPSCSKKPIQSGDRLIFSQELSESSEGFRVEAFEKLSLVEEKSFWFCSRNRLLGWAIKKYFKGANNFLEIGCGTGFVLSYIEKQFPDIKLYGSEIYNQGLNFAQERVSKANLIQMDARKIPYKDEFDVIGAFDVIEHIQDDNLVLMQMYQAIKPGGGAILTVPQHPFLWSGIDEYACHVRRYKSNELKSKVESIGFKVIRMTSFVSLLLPLLFLSRLRWKWFSGLKDYGPGFELPTPINYLLERILDVERLAVCSGASFPFGSSLLMVLKKV